MVILPKKILISCTEQSVDSLFNHLSSFLMKILGCSSSCTTLNVFLFFDVVETFKFFALP